MTLHVQEPWEPFTPKKSKGEDFATFAQSEAFHILSRDLRRYVRREIHGRSYLISGHRGAGKTTLALCAVENVQDEMSQEGRMPLLIRLQALQLLAPSEERQGHGGSKKEVSDDSSNGNNLSGLAQQALIRLTEAVYRSLAQEVARRYRARMERLPRFGRRDGKELAAHFLLMLDEAPGPDVLRDFWRRADALQEGILFPNPDDPESQGLRELSAVATAAQAYRVVSGEFSEESSGGASTEQANESQRSFAVRNKTMDRAAALLAGGLVGAGVLTSSTLNGLLAAGAALLTFVAFAGAMSWTSSRRQSRSQDYNYKFIRDRQIQTLERELPILMQRLHDAGLAPVFLIDELDKVDDLPRHMGKLVNHLKHFVTEGAFFCFLTDRDYYEHLRERTQKTPYPREHTYFSDRLFVLYQPAELRRYIESILMPRDVAGADKTAKHLLPYVLLHRARLNPGDIHRALARLLNPEGHIKVASGDLASTLGYRFNVMIQLAVETVLSGPELASRLEHDLDFAQVAYDTLYYPSWSWIRGDGVLDAGIEALREYLETRRGLANKSAQTRPVLSETDLTFLHGRLNELLDLLCEPENLVDKMSQGDTAYVEPKAIDAVPVPRTSSREERLIEEDSVPDKSTYRWLYDASGLPRPSLGEGDFGDVHVTGESTDTGELPEQRFALRLQEALGELGLTLDYLAEEVSILAPSPAWHRTQRAIGRLSSNSKISQDERQEELAIVKGYLGMLFRRGRFLAQSIFVAADIARADPQQNSQNRLQNGLVALSEELGLQIKPFEEAQRDLDRIVSLMDKPSKIPKLEMSSFDSWWRVVREEWARINQPIAEKTLAAVGSTVLSHWKNRLRDLHRTGLIRPPLTQEDLLAKVAQLPPYPYLTTVVEAMTLMRWSRLAEVSVDREWDAYWLEEALYSLNFGATRTRVSLKSLQDVQRTPPPAAVISAAEDSRLIADWETSKYYAAIVLTGPKAPELVQEIFGKQGELARRQTPVLLLIDPPTQGESRPGLDDLKKLWSERKEQIFYLVGSQDEAEGLEHLVARRGLDDAMSRGLRQMKRRQERSA